jgi:hypothetical protein
LRAFLRASFPGGRVPEALPHSAYVYVLLGVSTSENSVMAKFAEFPFHALR